MTNKILLLFSAFILALSFTACKSKKSVDNVDGAVETSEGGDAPQIDSTPMNFDASGSDSGNIAGLQTVNFEYDRATLSADMKQKLQANAEWLKSNSRSNIQIEGHTDSRGSIEYNLSLGERRAKAVKSYLATLGISGSRMSVISYGKEKPLSQGDSESDHARNRRANFVPISQ